MLESLVNPKSVAIIGASQDPAKLGYTILNNIISGGYRGSIYPINPKADEILGQKCYKSILDIQESVDLTVIVVPAKVVPRVIEDCGKKGVPSVVVITGGFAEAGEDGAKIQEELLEAAKRSNVRVLGPNCQGLNLNSLNLCATWPLMKSQGNISIISQSGTVFAALQVWGLREGIGFDRTYALGNRVDIDETELIESLSGIEETSVIGVYVESILNPKQFLEKAQKVSSNIPIIALKGGRTEEGSKAVMSHTRSLAGKPEIYSAAFRKAGVIEVSSLEDMYDAIKALSLIPLKKYQKIQIVTTSGGCGILAVDNLSWLGLNLHSLSEKAKNDLSQKLPDYCILSNPLDLTGDADAERFRSTFEVLVNEPDIDVIVSIFGDPVEGAHQVVKEFFSSKPMVASFLGAGEIELEETKKMQSIGIPVYPTPERAIKAISFVNKYKIMH